MANSDGRVRGYPAICMTKQLATTLDNEATRIDIRTGLWHIRI